MGGRPPHAHQPVLRSQAKGQEVPKATHSTVLSAEPEDFYPPRLSRQNRPQTAHVRKEGSGSRPGPFQARIWYVLPTPLTTGSKPNLVPVRRHHRAPPRQPHRPGRRRHHQQPDHVYLRRTRRKSRTLRPRFRPRQAAHRNHRIGTTSCTRC